MTNSIDYDSATMVTLTLPAHWVNYIIHQCAMDIKEIEHCHRILEREGVSLNDYLEHSDQPFFTFYHDAQEKINNILGSNCLEYTFKLSQETIERFAL